MRALVEFFGTRLGRVIGGVLMATAFLLLIRVNNFTSAKNVELLRAMKREAARLAPPPSAERTALKTFVKYPNMSATAEYSYRGTAKELLTHYDQFLRRDGWRFCRHQDLLAWDEKGGWVRFYDKPPFSAIITYGGPREPFGYTFSVMIDDDLACD